MINPQNQKIAKIVETLEQMNLFTADEITLMEDFLNGGLEEPELEKLAFRDLTAVPDDVSSRMSSLTADLINKGRNEEANRLGKILFAAGQSTCYGLLPIRNYYSFDAKMIPLEEPEKKAAVYAIKVAMNEYQISSQAVTNLMKAAEEKPENLKKAIGYQKNKYSNGKLILLMTYFRMKYRNVKLVEKGAESKAGGILAGVGKLLGIEGAETEPVVEIGSEDAALLKEYGDILVGSIGHLYRNQMSQTEVSEIANAIERNKVDERILKMARPNLAVDRFMLRLLGGCAFVNYAQSSRFKNVVKICLAAGGENMLDIMDSLDLRGALNEKGGIFDEIFAVDCRVLIKWAAVKGKTGILREQFKRNRDAYLNYMNAADFDTYNRMNSVLKEQDPQLYKERMDKEIYRQQAKVVQAFVEIVDGQLGNTVRDYLNGAAGLDTLYACEDKLQTSGNRWANKQLNILQSYQRGYGHDALSNRCETFWMVYRGNNYNNLKEGGEIKAATIKRLFKAVDSEGLDLKHQLCGYSDIYDSFYMEKWKKSFRAGARLVFLGYLETRREEMLAAFRETGSDGRCLGVQVLAEHPEENKAELLEFAQDSSKAVKEELLYVLYGRKSWEEDICKLLSSKKAAEREIAIRVLTKWDDEKYNSALTQALEKEKNGKVRTLLETALHVTSEGNTGGGKAITCEDMVKELHKGGKKRSLAWAYETPFSVVHKKSGEEAGEEYLQAIFLCYAGMSPCGVSPSAAMLAEALNEKEFEVYVNELFDKWMEAGAESKKRWVLYAASIHGGGEIVKKLHHQIQEWPNAARGAIASEAVQALALNPQPQALLIVDGISRKFKFKQVKAAAGKALDFAAAQLGITTEELADRIVPDLGFNENMEREFDYGERKFTVSITTALEIEVYDEKGKKLKNLPSPGKRDDEVMAAAAYDEFKQMKKQMKTTVSSQKMRLEMALSTGRQWSVEAWKRLFVKNPIMHQFATGLIWGVYEDRKLVSTFRYMEDGSFNTEDEEEFELPEEKGQSQAALSEAEGTGAQNAEQGADVTETQNAEQKADGADAENTAQRAEAAQPGAQTDSQGKPAGKSGQLIGLVHPVELSEDSLKTWKEQLEDYEITQPIEQLDRPVYYRTKEEEESKSLERFGGCIVNDLSLGGKLQTLGWYRGSVQDAGGFYSYYREDKELGLGVELHFSGSYVGGENEDVTVYEARFYNAGGTLLSENGGVMAGNTIKRGSYVYDEANDSNSYFLREVPERYFSEIVLQLARATAASKEKNVNWKDPR